MFKEVSRPEFWILDRKKVLPDKVHKTVVSPLHYGDTLEVFLVRGIEGETFINGKKFDFAYENIFLIPPGYLHTSNYRKGGNGEEDMICAFHINIELLASVLDIKKVLLSDDRTLYSFPIRLQEFQGIWALIQEILREESLFSTKLSYLLQLFTLLGEQAVQESGDAQYNKAAIRLVDWVEEHYGEQVTIQKAAEEFGFSKYYFCRWFKENTGATFNDFLNTVRIHHACRFLASGYTIMETAKLCGFEDSSYFIKVFKRVRGLTPGKYAEQESRS